MMGLHVQGQSVIVLVEAVKRMFSPVIELVVLANSGL